MISISTPPRLQPRRSNRPPPNPPQPLPPAPPFPRCNRGVGAVLDLALTGFLMILLGMGLKRPFIWVLAYLYVDIFSPQRVSYGILAAIQPSLIVFVLSVLGWLTLDRKAHNPFSWRQGMILMLLAYCGITTLFADFPDHAADKWAWVWKALLFAAFLPATLGSRLRIEGAALAMVLSAATIIIDGGIKTATGGGGYAELHLLVNNNTGLYEGSTLSTVAIAIIPLALWLARHGTIFPTDWRVKLFTAGLIIACLLIPVGTAARTGLVCAGLLGLMMLRSVKRRGLYIGIIAAGAMIAIPLLPASYTDRMNTIGNAKADASASTRLAVWAWTIDYAGSHPFGGGFDAFRGDHLNFKVESADTNGTAVAAQAKDTTEKGRAFHSSYFEMLGEQGWPGLILWLTLQLSGLAQLQMVRRRLKGSQDPGDISDRALATALQEGHVVYLLGAAFVGIAFQPFVFMLIGLQIALVAQVRKRRERAGEPQPAAPAVSAPLSRPPSVQVSAR